MAEGSSPKGNTGVFAKKVQRQLSRGKEKVLQRLGKTVETRDDQFDHCLNRFNDQQTDGNRIYKDLKVYLSAVREMREASRRLSQSLFDSYDTEWTGEEDLGAIVEGEDLLWNDFEVKLVDQAIHTMESYMAQFPDVREKISKRGRKLVDYDSSRHHLEALQTAKKRDDVKILKAEEELNATRKVYEGINDELKQELPTFLDSRIGCYVGVFSAVATLREIFYKELNTLNHDLHNVMKELQAQHPDKVFVVRGLQRYGSLKRRSLISPKSWKSSFSEFHMNYSPRLAHQKFSFKSPDKSRNNNTLSRENSKLAVYPQSPPPDGSSSELRELDEESNHSDGDSSSAEVKSGSDREDSKIETAGVESSGDANRGEENDEGGVAEPKLPSGQHSITSDNKGEGEKPPLSESSSEPNNSYDSGSLELQLSAVESSRLYIEESIDSQVAPQIPQTNGLEDGAVSGLGADSKPLQSPHKDAPIENQASLD
ncbi:bridging integrator 2a, partial [Lampris incognitus]|uniref:bridging integrator 2a n=1 Tax=Lampris incognitus TaxID=2546036 RepID=UPI0024B48CCE